MTRRYTRFTGLAQVAEVRAAEFEGREHLVVPVVALVGDTVVYPLGAPGPELVPANVLARSVHEWNGRPVVGDHPVDGKTPVSANDPEVYERTCFGRISYPKWEGGRLKIDAYIDPEKAERVGRDAVRVCERVRAGEMVEVSIGAYVEVEQRSGVTADGQEYVGVWQDIGSDHLAMLPEGSEGACSIEMGCGAPRAAKRNEGKKMGPLHRLFASLGLRVAQEDMGQSDDELRGSLWAALRAIEPGFDGIVEVYPESTTVIYAVWPEDSLLFYRRSYTVDDDKVSLADDREEVEAMTRWEVVRAESAEDEADETDEDTTNSTTAGTACGCTTAQLRAAHNDTAAKAEGDHMATIKDLVGRLIQCGKSPFTEEDRAMLEAATPERLQALVDGFAESGEDEVKEETPKPAVEPEPKPEPEKAAEPMTEEQWLRAAPQSLRSMVEQHKADEAAKRARLVAGLSKAQSTYTAEQLGTKDTADLEALGKILKLDEPAPDYSGRGIPTIAEAEDESIFDPPDTYGLRKAAETKEAN